MYDYENEMTRSACIVQKEKESEEVSRKAWYAWTAVDSVKGNERGARSPKGGRTEAQGAEEAGETGEYEALQDRLLIKRHDSVAAK